VEMLQGERKTGEGVPHQIKFAGRRKVCDLRRDGCELVVEEMELLKASEVS